MQMEHTLTGGRAIIDYQTEGIGDAKLFRHAVGSEQEVPQQCLVRCCRIGKARYFLLWNDEHVRRRLGIDVTESETQIILVDDIGRHLAPDDFAENSTHHPSFQKRKRLVTEGPERVRGTGAEKWR